jgi:integrase
MAICKWPLRCVDGNMYACPRTRSCRPALLLSLRGTIPGRAPLVVIEPTGWTEANTAAFERHPELRGLTLDRINFLRRTVTIDRQLDPKTKAGVAVWGPPKTQASYRVVPLAKSVADLISAHLARFPVGEDGLVFTNTEGRPILGPTYGEAFRKATRSLGVDVTSHDLRHYAASMLIASGSSVKAVQSFLGHQNAAETLDTYSHLWPDDERIRDAVDRAFGDPEERLRNNKASLTS